MHVPQWLKPACWGIVVVALGIMILGFAWWGWVLGSTAERLANDRADSAVTAILVPICVERFLGQADAEHTSRAALVREAIDRRLTRLKHP